MTAATSKGLGAHPPVVTSYQARLLTPEETESFLMLWERVIEQCDERHREDMEEERETLWEELEPGERTRRRARALLSQLSRSVNTDDEEGRGDDLKLDMAELFRSLAGGRS